jgi:shikimate dehydrogenase
MNLGLIGKSIQYSLSPQIHNYWLQKYHIPGEYVLIDDDFEEIVALIQTGRFDGLNVTIPYKTKILELVTDWSSKLQSKLQAVNTLKFTKDHKVLAINTDYEAACDILSESDCSRVVILGSGGAAKAMIAAAQTARIKEIHVSSRKPLDGSFDWHPWADRDRLIKTGGWLINATSVKDEALFDDWSQVSCCDGVVDLTYDRHKTPYLTQIAEQSNIGMVTGKTFLLRQAQKSFHYWTGIFPEIDSALIESIS